MKKIKLITLLYFLFIILFSINSYAATIGISYTPGIIKTTILPGKWVTIEQPIRVISLSDHTRHITLTLMTPKNFKEGRTVIPDFKWISFSEKEFNITPHGYRDIYIRVFIPNRPENYGKNWEVWIKALAEKTNNSLFNIECIGRLLIDTPEISQPIKGLKIIIPTIAILTTIILVGVFIYKNKIAI